MTILGAGFMTIAKKLQTTGAIHKTPIQTTDHHQPKHYTQNAYPKNGLPHEISGARRLKHQAKREVLTATRMV
jgi:hypothetical protein